MATTTIPMEDSRCSVFYRAHNGTVKWEYLLPNSFRGMCIINSTNSTNSNGLYLVNATNSGLIVYRAIIESSTATITTSTGIFAIATSQAHSVTWLCFSPENTRVTARLVTT